MEMASKRCYGVYNYIIGHESMGNAFHESKMKNTFALLACRKRDIQFQEESMISLLNKNDVCFILESYQRKVVV